MFCNNCGKPISEGTAFCPECGNKVEFNKEPLEVVGNLNEPVKVEDNNPNNETNNATIKILLYLLAIAGIAVTAFTGYILYDKMSSKNEAKKEVKESTPVTPVVNDDKKVTISYDGYTFKIPEDYNYDITDTGVYIMDDSYIWEARFSLYDRSIDSLINNKEAVTQKFESLGAKVSNVVSSSINDKKYIIYVLTQEGVNFYIGYVEADINKSSGFELYNKSNQFNSDNITDLVKILTTVKYIGSTKSITTNKMLDLNMVEEAIK